MKKKYFLLKVLFLVFSSSLFAQNPVPTIEYQALVDFYNSMDGDNWQTKWDISSNNLHLTEWFGVVVENEHVVEINLRSNGINGAIPTSFSNLKYLRKFDLSYGPPYRTNDLSATDLNNLSGLESLEELNLYYCKIVGSIPKSWGQLTKLKSLILNNNNLEGDIFSEIGNLTALETINFSYNKLVSIPITIDNLTNLKTLNLRYNEITNLPKELENLTNLTQVYAEGNQISDVLPLLPTNIYMNLNSQTLSLGEFTYTGEDVLLTNLPNITRYDRNKNDFSATNTFNVMIDGSNVSTNLIMEADGSLLIPKENLSSITPDKLVSLRQVSGTANGSVINFTTTTVDLPAVPDIEYQALVDFYNAMDGNSWINKWDVTVNNLNQGAWYGLVIENGHIVEINLPNNRVKGAIPASFSDLKFLRKLDLNDIYSNRNDLSTTDLNNLSGLESLEGLNLNYCNITGVIPSSWGQLTNLKSLVLSHNTLEGPIFTEIGSLTALETIDVSYNSLTSVPEALGNLTALETINFSYNKLVSIPITIDNLTNLKTLNLRYNEITNLPKELENLTNLTQVYAEGNQISDVLPLLPTNIYMNLNSQTLSLGEFTYTGEDVLLTNLPNITRYDRNKNDFSATNTFNVMIDGSNVSTNLIMEADGSLLIPKENLSSITPDKLVSLRQVSGTANGSVINFTTTTVDLPAVPDIEYQALVDFYNAMDGNSWINKWDVTVNNLNQGAWYGLVIENGHIVEINLPNNRVKGAIPASFSDLKFLRKLDLNDIYSNRNDLSTTDLNNLSGLESLEGLNLNYCNITGVIPSSWGQLTNLKSLVLSHNTLEGPIFTEIGSLTALETIDVSYNSLTSVPEALGNLTALETINFSYNKLVSIPITIDNLTNLKTLNLRYNEITNLPKELENLTNLTQVYAEGNQISDVLPLLPTNIYMNLNSQTLSLGEFTYTGEDVLLTNLPNITRYDRNKNDFSATNTFNVMIDGSNVSTNLIMEADGSLLIPKENLSSITPDKLVSLRQVSGTANGSVINFTTTTVDLPAVPDIEYQALVDFYNAMDGNSWINKWDVTVNNLNQGAWYGLVIENGHIVEINLPNNRVKGAIPASFSDLKFLRKLDLNDIYSNRNDLSTTDLNNLSGLESLEGLNLNYCNITGVIPSSWGQLTNLKSLVLSHNTLTTIPIAMGNLINLETMDLSYNEIVSSGTNFSDLILTTLNFKNQNISIESIEIGANEINIDLPIHLTFELIDGQVSIDARNEFQLFVNGTYQKTSFSNNGKLIFTNINVLNLQVTDKLRIYQVNGISAYSNINYDSLTFGAPLVDEEFEILKKIYASTNGESWTNTWDITENNLNIESWYGVSIKDGHVVSVNLANNNLSGVLPEEITGLKRLKTLSLNNNVLEGSIPVDINLLTDLETLDLSSNLFSGIIPVFISELNNLKKFTIGNNNFSGTIPSVLSDFITLEYLDLSSNSFDKVEKKLYYDYTKTYIDLRNQVINVNSVLNLEGNQLKVDLGNISKYDLENNNFDAKNSFVLLVNNVTHTSTITNDSNEIVFNDVRIGEIPIDAKISIRQTTGTFRNTEFIFSGIEDKSNVPVFEEEYLALTQLYNTLNGDEWFNKWDISSNNLHTNKWFGVSTYDGHIVAIDLRSNNVSGSIPNIFSGLPYLNTLNLSSNMLTGIDAILPETIDFIFDRQTIEAGEIDLNNESVINDFNINRYEHANKDFNNQTYNLRIGTFSKTINLSDNGIKLLDLIKIWKVPNNQKLELRQVSGDAKNSIINYYLKYASGDSNLDSKLNVLDIQTSINYITNNYITSFNYNAADIDSNADINVLDIIGQVNIIQSQEVTSTTGKNISKVQKLNTNNSKISIENGLLLLDTNGNDVASFEILIQNVSKEALEELISPFGFSVSISNINNHVRIIAYSFNASLNGKIELAKVANPNPIIKSVILSDISALEISSEILDNTLGTDSLAIEQNTKAHNFPNPFKQETVINFYTNTSSAKTTLSIYDMSGRNLEKIELENITKGKNQYVFKRGNLSSGVYLYIISSKDNRFVLTGKMTIE